MVIVFFLFIKFPFRSFQHPLIVPFFNRLLSKLFKIGLLVVALSLNSFTTKGYKTYNPRVSSFEVLEYINDLNIKFPEIVYAQAILETGNFTSNICIENNNLFGMQQATIRPTTSVGSKNNHANYTSWKESVMDYALYQCYYLSDIKTEQDYLEYLDKNYSEIGDKYSVRLLKIINNL